MLIGGFQKASLIDYPEKIACVIFTQGCNFRCPYCHNPELLNQQKTNDSLIEESFVFDFLEKRKGKLDAVVISGGEPCLQNNLISFMKRIKEIGYLIKLDTNGSFFQVLEKIINERLADYIAMDIKAPLLKYHQTAKIKIDSDSIKQSINLIKNSEIPHEFRTTVLKELISKDDLLNIAQMLGCGEKYYIQKFVPSKIYDKSLAHSQNFSDEEFEKIKEEIISIGSFCSLR